MIEDGIMGNRQVDITEIRNTVKDLSIEANTVLRSDVLEAIQGFYDRESNASAKNMLKVLITNAALAREKQLALCQDTGMVAVFIDIGKDVSITGGNITDAVNDGVKEAYSKGHFRKSVVNDPILRDNTGTNTPAVVHIDIVDGDKVGISVMPKGFGAENKGTLAMLEPTAGCERIIDFCVETVKAAGPDACPPYVLGVGIGGTMEKCAMLAKKALLRPLDQANPQPHIAKLENEIKEKVNALKIGIMGLGGISTVMGVAVETAPTHIAGLPVAVNLSCHALRSASRIL